MELFRIFFVYSVCGMSVLVITIRCDLMLTMVKRSADMEFSCECIKCTVPDRSEMVVFCVRERC